MSDNRFKIARDWSKLEIKNQGLAKFVKFYKKITSGIRTRDLLKPWPSHVGINRF